MQFLRSARWLLLALLVTLIPVTSHAQFSISVGFAPPALQVEVQPLPPTPDMMWTPGYWAWDPNQANYYWVPGTWVAAPRPGFLWTPGYWGWSGGRFFFHEGYWGPHIGYYGGVNYGYGYGGIGFAGGEWRGGHFFYNTAIMHVDIHDRRFGGYVFNDRGRVDRGFVARDSRVAFSGGPGGIRHDPSPEERIAERDQHVARTNFQQSREQAAHSDRNSFSKSNSGHPVHAMSERSMPMNDRNQPAHDNHMTPNHQQPATHSAPTSRPAPMSHSSQSSHSAQQSHSAPAAHTAPAPHSAPASHSGSKEEHKH